MNSENSNRQLTREDFARFIREMERMYGNKFCNNSNRKEKSLLWGDTFKMYGLSYQGMMIGLNKCAKLIAELTQERKEAWPPDPMPFVMMCTPDEGDLGLPDKDTAYYAAASGDSKRLRSHPAIYYAANGYSDWDIEPISYELRRETERNSRPKFNKNWKKITDKYKQGEVLPPVPMFNANFQLADKTTQELSENSQEIIDALKSANQSKVSSDMIDSFKFGIDRERNAFLMLLPNNYAKQLVMKKEVEKAFFPVLKQYARKLNVIVRVG